MRVMIRMTSAAFALLLACGGSSEPAPEMPSNNTAETGTETAAPMEGEHKEGSMDGEHKHEFPPNVDAFHDVLKPLWHADAGEKRTADTCAQAKSLSAAAMKIAEGDVPEKAAAHADAWKQASEGLIAAVSDLEMTCGNPERLGMFDDGFKNVHDAFHALIAHLGHEEKSK